ncbi:MAG TPA: NlpC/P60 family protein [Miltoncostaeaceae bacterium]|nr:NlpC/P60 family protein [Miltoncostaeaceae bacterium]
MQVEVAAEAYNGARWELGEVNERIADNRQQTAVTARELKSSRVILAKRLRSLYATPQPSLIEVLISSGSVTAAADQVDLLDRIGEQDAQVVGGLRDQKARLAELRTQLEKDREKAEEAVAAREREKERIERLLAQRQAVLDSASDELRGLIAAEERRREQEAARQAEIARQREAAETAAATNGGAPASAPVGSSSVSSEPTAPSTPAPSASEPEQEQPTASVPSASGNARAAQIAMTQLGVPYVWGGASPSVGFDCSGLASWAYAQIGKSVPHFTGAIWAVFPRVPSGQLEPGDLVFFRADLGHMGIYIGGGQYVNAPQTGDVVKVSSLANRSDYQGAVRP